MCVEWISRGKVGSFLISNIELCPNTDLNIHIQRFIFDFLVLHCYKTFENKKCKMAKLNCHKKYCRHILTLVRTENIFLINISWGRLTMLHKLSRLLISFENWSCTTFKFLISLQFVATITAHSILHCP